MDTITVKNFRCFREEQTVRLAPLTLLVGENSTGKTSFLALIRALAYVGYGDMPPNFRQQPYDLGSFGEIVYNPGGSADRYKTFEAGFTRNFRVERESGSNDSVSELEFRATFKNRLGVPFPVRRRIGDGANWIEHSQSTDDGEGVVQAVVGGKTVNATVSEHTPGFGHHLLPLSFAAHLATMHCGGEGDEENPEVEEALRDLVLNKLDVERTDGPPFASSPVRSRPSRTYDPIDVTRDSEGEYIPTYLARMSMLGGQQWEKFQSQILEFGRKSGLFDDLKIERFGDSEGSPFQIHVRKHSRRRKGPFRNLVDMGYGISQVLPILTELLRADGPNRFMLQQPEVHLHPSAQAALGSLFCSIAISGKQLFVETHSDNLIDRIRMDVRDQVGGINSDHISILYFERVKLGVKIHSIGIDETGQIYGAPPGYRQFFMDEVNRSIGLASVAD